MGPLRVFELREQLEANGSAQAVLLEWRQDSYVPTATTITVYDFVGGHGLPGDRGYCFESPESQRWEVLTGLLAQDYPSVA